MFKVRIEIPEQELLSFERAENSAQSDIILNYAMKKLHNKLMTGIMFQLQQKAKTNAPVRTGYLKNHIGVQKIKDGWQLVASVPYAQFVESGTGLYRKDNPGYIIPKKARFLVFKGKGGKLIFAKKVRGQPGQFYMARAMEDIDDAIKKAFASL